MATFYSAEQIELASHNRSGMYRVADLLHDIMTRKIPLDANVYYERIEDKYFRKGWQTYWFPGVNDEPSQYISAFQGFKNSVDNPTALLITAHY